MPLHLFPHFHPPEPIIKKIVSFLGPIKMYLPWLMEPPGFIDDMSIEISNPPKELKPHESLKAMLSEYRNWAKENRDMIYLGAVKSGRALEPADNTTWEIRRMLVNSIQSLPERNEEIIRWHLLLHLAGEIEEQRLAADNMLKALKKKKSPLDGSIEKAIDIKSLLKDLPELGPSSVMNDLPLGQIFEAWFNLFGEFLKEKDLLITYNRQITDYISERWDALSISDNSTNSPTVGFSVPDLSHHAPGRQKQIQKEYNIDERLEEIKDLIMSMGKRPTHNITEINIISENLDKYFPWELSDGTMRYSLRHLYPISHKSLPESDKIIGRFFNHTIILAEEQVSYEKETIRHSEA
ncbi:hypothetical protein OAC89_05105 [Deltaproteobacteria bacterium]|nr:hypothetical protein [Deltaproteobacteria bacterium]